MYGYWVILQWEMSLKKYMCACIYTGYVSDRGVAFLSYHLFVSLGLTKGNLVQNICW